MPYFNGVRVSIENDRVALLEAKHQITMDVMIHYSVHQLKGQRRYVAVDEDEEIVAVLDRRPDDSWHVLHFLVPGEIVNIKDESEDYDF